jgi:hypothetical protein
MELLEYDAEYIRSAQFKEERGKIIVELKVCLVGVES